MDIRRELAAVGEAAERVADAVKLPLAQHGVREVRVVLPVGVRCQRPDSRVLQPCPEAADQALSRSIEERANSQGHEPMMASHQTGAPGRARPRSAQSRRNSAARLRGSNPLGEARR